MNSQDILASLSRSDKGVLSGGNRFLFAPQWPIHEEKPGFWDEGHVYNYPLSPLFTYALLDENGSEIALKFASRIWRPDRLVRTFTTDDHLKVVESSAMRPDDVLGTRLAIQNTGTARKRLHVVLWTCQPGDAQFHIDLHGIDSLVFQRELVIRDQPPYPVTCLIRSDRATMSKSIVHSQGPLLPPQWKYTPFYDTFDGSLAKLPAPEKCDPGGVVYAGLHHQLEVDPGETVSLEYGFGVTTGSTPVAEIPSANQAATHHLSAATGEWKDFFDGVPTFECSSPFLEKFYNYRWFGLRMNMIRGGEDNYRYPAVCEGPSYFRAPISYSAQCHILETRWMKHPRVAQGSLLNFIHNQQPDGRFIGYLAPRSLPGEFFYHANWGFIRDLDLIHPDAEFLKHAYEGLSSYVAYFDRERDPAGTGLYDIHNHYETGQEYMHRYVAVDRTADQQHWGTVFRLKGVDVSVYLYETKQALADIACKLNRNDEAEHWDSSARGTGRAILNSMWDPETEMFFDIDPATGDRTGVKAAVCFYPYFTDLVDESHLAGLKRHLFNKDEFWTPWPVPSSSLDDPFFDGDARWKNQRMNCPWNGRVWPMTNSHIAEALARSAIRFGDEELRHRTAEFVTRFIEMMFFDRDPDRPNTFEHYHPFSGRASIYRGIDDYQHSWVLDLIIKYLCGIRPTPDGVIIDPFPFDLDRFSIDRVPIRGHNISVERDQGDFSVRIDGSLCGTSSLGRHIELSL